MWNNVITRRIKTGYWLLFVVAAGDSSAEAVAATTTQCGDCWGTAAAANGAAIA